MTASAIACGLLLVGIFIYVFYPERNVEAQHLKTRLEYLRERREVLYDNLRDLNFERSAGKYPEEDYLAQRAALENETAEVLAEIDLLESQHGGLAGVSPFGEGAALGKRIS
jgi:hypothetical protein